jgi:hypothetical protein
LKEGIKTNNIELINKALSKGVTNDDGLAEAIIQNKIAYVKLFIDKGASPSSHIGSAVMNNNIEIVKCLLEKGAKFLDIEDLDLDGQTYYDGKPIYSRFLGDRNKWVDDKGVVVYNTGGDYTFKVKKILTGNLSIIHAIDNNNSEMLDLILKNGADPNKICNIYGYAGPIYYNQRTMPGNIFGAPSPPTFMMPLEYASYKKANSDILSILLKYGAKN